MSSIDVTTGYDYHAVEIASELKFLEQHHQHALKLQERLDQAKEKSALWKSDPSKAQRQARASAVKNLVAALAIAIFTTAVVAFLSHRWLQAQGRLEAFSFSASTFAVGAAGITWTGFFAVRSRAGLKDSAKRAEERVEYLEGEIHETRRPIKKFFKQTAPRVRRYHSGRIEMAESVDDAEEDFHQTWGNRTNIKPFPKQTEGTFYKESQQVMEILKIAEEKLGDEKRTEPVKVKLPTWYSPHNGFVFN